MLVSVEGMLVWDESFCHAFHATSRPANSSAVCLQGAPFNTRPSLCCGVVSGGLQVAFSPQIESQRKFPEVASAFLSALNESGEVFQAKMTPRLLL